MFYFIANVYITLNNTRNLFASIKFCSESTVVTGVGAVSPASTLDMVCKLCTLEDRNSSFYLQHDNALSLSTLKMKAVRNFHREPVVCKFARAKLLNCQEISNRFRLADPRNGET